VEPVPFGKYLLCEPLAQGGMAEVFRAVMQGPAGVEKQVALKRILPFLASSPDFVTMFVDEARIACSLTHVNIAQVFEFGQVDGAYYLAMELVDGADLGRLLSAAQKRNLQVPPALCAFIAAEAARGLAYAHERRGPGGALLGIVHRDVSPQNVLCSFAGEVKLADFGIAKAAGKVYKTDSGAVMGKLRYLSPEQIAGEPLDARSDLFSLGAVLYELLTGRPLFDGENPGRVTDQVRRGDLAPPSSRVGGIPAELDRICLRALSRDREARYLRAADLARELGAFLAEAAPGLGREDLGAFLLDLFPRPAAAEPTDAYAQTESVAPPPPGPAALGELPPLGSAATTTRPERRPARQARRGWVPLGALAGVVLLGVAGLFWWRGGGGPQAVVLADLGGEDAEAPDAAPAPSAGVDDAERARLLGALESLPRVEATRRGTEAADYVAILTAVDALLCEEDATLPFPPERAQALQPWRVEPEARALYAYVAGTGELPRGVALSLRVFLTRRPPYLAGRQAFAGLALLAQPERADLIIARLKQNAELGRGPAAPADAGPRRLAWLCDRRALVERLVAAGASQRAERLRRYLAARPGDAAVEHEGILWRIESAAWDEAAASLEVRLRVENPRGEARTIELTGLRLAGREAPPAAPPPPRLGPGEGATVRLVFTPLAEEEAEAATLVVATGLELQAHTELLR
jgi:hypothetical protein